MMKSEWKELTVKVLSGRENYFSTAIQIAPIEGFAVAGLMSIARTALARFISCLIVSALHRAGDGSGSAIESCIQYFW
jgi:hypothetical protein